MKKVLILDGLGCAGCAAKIETQTKNLKGVNNAAIDFASKQLTIEFNDEKEFKRIFGDISDLVKKIESDVKVIDADKKKSKKVSILIKQ